MYLSKKLTILKNNNKNNNLIYNLSLYISNRFYSQFSFTSPTSFSQNWHHKLNSLLPANVKEYVETMASVCQPEYVHVCNGTDKDKLETIRLMRRQGILRPLIKYDNCWSVRSDPIDTSRVEHKTMMVSSTKRDSIPLSTDGHHGKLGNWIGPRDMEIAFKNRFPGCMRGRTMYVIPFSMGPIDSKISKFGIQLTDSPYVVASMNILTRVGNPILETIGNQSFTKCLHSLGDPLPSYRKLVNSWPCNPEKMLVAHIPRTDEIISFGSGYGGNAFLGKKCMGLRLGSVRARDEGWLAEHMLIIGITNPKGIKKYIAAAFPSSCGKTNLAMMLPSLPGYKIEMIGDDIAWMWFDDKGQLRAVNPENGIFAVAPGTNSKTNPNAMNSIKKNTLFTNIAEISDGGFYWEGLEEEVAKDAFITNWQGEKWSPDSGKMSAHPNSRYCISLNDCSFMDPQFENPEGVPIDAILFGGRRPDGVPLVMESLDWSHGVLLGASMKTEPTPASELKGSILHDPFAMRPFLGYNFGKYLENWFSFEKSKKNILPRIYHVNFFRKDPATNRFLWPGYGENCRILDWIIRRLDEPKDSGSAIKTAIGYIPSEGQIDTNGLSNEVARDIPRMLNIDRDFWLNETKELKIFFHNQLNYDFPSELIKQLTDLEARLHTIV